MSYDQPHNVTKIDVSSVYRPMSQSTGPRPYDNPTFIPEIGNSKGPMKDVQSVNTGQAEQFYFGNNSSTRERNMNSQAVPQVPRVVMPEQRNSEVKIDDKEKEDDPYWEDDEDETIDDRLHESMNPIAKAVIYLQWVVITGWNSMNKHTKNYALPVIFCVAYLFYFCYAMGWEYDRDKEPDNRLLVCTIIVFIIITRFLWLRPLKLLYKAIFGEDGPNPRLRLVVRIILSLALLGLIIWALYDQAHDDVSNLRGLVGICVFLLVPFLFSIKPHKINWNTIYWSLGLQFSLALAVLKWSGGRDAAVWLKDRLEDFYGNARAGSILVFGDSYADHYLAMAGLPIAFYFNAIVTLLFYFGIVQLLIKIIGGILRFILDTSVFESMTVAGSILLDGIGNIILIRPYLPNLTKSELFVVITASYASLGGTFLAILQGITLPAADGSEPIVAANLAYIIPGMIISAPATFTIAKLMYPETVNLKDDTRVTEMEIMEEEKKKYSNFLDAFQTGATALFIVIGNVICTIFAFESTLSLINNTLGWFGERVGLDGLETGDHCYPRLSLELIFSYVLYPLSWLIGIEPEDCRAVAVLHGYKLIGGNFFAFVKLAEYKALKLAYNYGMEQYKLGTSGLGPVVKQCDSYYLVWNNNTRLTKPIGGFISERSEAIASYSLCGLSSVVSMAITMGFIISVLPKRKNWFMSVAIPALLAGNIANYMTGCFASIFFGSLD